MPMTFNGAIADLTSPHPTVPALLVFLGHVQQELSDQGTHRTITAFYPPQIDHKTFEATLSHLSAEHWEEVSVFLDSRPMINAIASFIIRVGNEHFDRLSLTPIMEKAIESAIEKFWSLHVPLSPALISAIPEPLFQKIIKLNRLIYLIRHEDYPHVMQAILDRPSAPLYVPVILREPIWIDHFIPVLAKHPIWPHVAPSIRRLSPKLRVLLLVSPQSNQEDIEIGLSALGQLKSNPLQNLTPMCDFSVVRWERLKPLVLLQALTHLYYSVKTKELMTHGPSQHLIDAALVTAHLRDTSRHLAEQFSYAQSHYVSTSEYQINTNTWLPAMLRPLLSQHGSPEEFYAMSQRIMEWVQEAPAERQPTGVQLLHYVWHQYSRDPTERYGPPSATLTHHLLTLRPPFLFHTGP